MMQSNTFDEVLGLEEQFYDDGFRQGLADGITAGRVEGRTFGLEKGFEKYVESGRLYGKSIIWANRMPKFQRIVTNCDEEAHKSTSPNLPSDHGHQSTATPSLPSLPDNQRLANHLKVLHALSESESLSTENTEEAVSDFDDRLKRARGKAKIIERIVGETKVDVEVGGIVTGGNADSIEDARAPNTRH